MRRLWIAAVAAGLLACGDDAEVGCAPGTSLVNGTCVPGAITFVCGEGTILSGGECVVPGGLTCGEGTWADGAVCRPTGVSGFACGAGTHLSGSVCVPDVAASCGTGTHLSGFTCVPDSAGVTCGAGTHGAGTVCLPDPQMTCGAGTHVAGTSCVPDAVLVCGAGTHPESGRCVRNASTTLEVRVAATTIPADGYSKLPVLVLGRAADGTPSTADVVIWVSRPGAGTFAPSAFPLGLMGTTSWFVPCSSTSPGCTGTFVINVSFAADPLTVVATSGPIELVAPAGVGSAAACLVGGNVLFFDGNDYIFHGTQTVRLGSFSASGSGANDVRIWIEPSDPTQGLWWDLEFSTRELGIPLATQVYESAQRAPFASPGHPGIDIGGDGRGCNTITGRFQIEELVWSGAALDRFTATFEQHCEGGSAMLRGCVHLGP